MNAWDPIPRSQRKKTKQENSREKFVGKKSETRFRTKRTLHLKDDERRTTTKSATESDVSERVRLLDERVVVACVVEGVSRFRCPFIHTLD